MDSQILSGLFNNSALLLAMCLLYDTLSLNRKTRGLHSCRAFSGIILGAIGVAVMVNPWQWQQGIIFDTRSILLSISGLFFGGVPTIIAMAITSLYRLYLGGSGALMGVSVIIASGTIGIVWRHRSRIDPAELTPVALYGFGVTVHLVMLALMALLPGHVVMESLVKIGIPVMVIYPIATVLLGMMMVSRHRNVRSEDALRESEKRYREVFDNSYDGIFLIEVTEDRRFKLLDINATEARLIGIPVSEARGKSLDEIFPSEMVMTLETNYRRCVESGVTLSYEEEVDFAAGLTDFHTTLIPLKDERGCVYRIIGISHDLTERKMAEGKVRESERLYRQLFELESDAIFLINAETGDILEANRTASTLYGYEREDLLTLKNTDLSAEPEETHRATADKLLIIPTRMHRKKDGTIFPVEITASHFSWKGKDVHLAAIRDISERIRADEERKELMAQLSQSQKMEAVGQLAGGIAHDFNNILTVIFGYAHLLLSKLEMTSPLRHPMEQILSSASRAADLTHGLLAFSRKQILATLPLNIGEVVRDTENMLRMLVREDIDFRVSVTDRTLTVAADRGQMGQMLVNLVTNAVDSMPGGGKLAIDVTGFEMDDLFVQTHGYGRPGGYAVITVTDNGCGMDAEMAKKVFEPFFTTKEVGKGTGLGLSIVYGIVKQHDGFISVESKKDIGSKFRIFLPLAKSTTMTGAAANSHLTKSVSGNETILLAEDAEHVRTMTARAYEAAGYRVIEACDGEDAVEKFVQHKQTIDPVSDTYLTLPTICSV